MGRRAGHLARSWLLVVLAGCTGSPTPADSRDADERRVVELARQLYGEPTAGGLDIDAVAARAAAVLPELNAALARLLGRDAPVDFGNDRDALAAFFDVLQRRDPELFAHVNQATEASRQARTRISLEQIGQVLELYRLDTGRYPDPERWTDALLGRGDSRQAYLSTETASLLVDGWDQPIRLELTENGFRLRSCGPDKVAETADDLTRGP